MQKGLPPLAARRNCRHPEGLPILNPGHLHVCWLPEGDGVELMEGVKTLLAILPPGSGEDGCDGFARAIGNGSVGMGT